MKSENNIQKKRIFNRLVAKAMSTEELLKVSGGSKHATPSGTSYCGRNCEPDDCTVEY
ncbi:hypothetical protein PALB_21660 [Pseudoalteromonas luteoviolacea B = ATCC 29581]|nr:hypothetical protein PALB_21660 [Pseudoalteromonas luteoviolacea B = ATCC 29581]